MNLMLSCLVLTVVVCGVITKQDFAPGQFLARIDETKFQTKSKVYDFIDHLESRFNLFVIRYYDFNAVKLLFLKGNEHDVMAAQGYTGIKFIEHNYQHQLSQECASTSAPGCWGLDRTDQREPLSYSEPDNQEATYVWGGNTGKASVVYVADSGVDYELEEFGSRAKWGYTAGSIPLDGDGNGHGTHIAGIVGSDSYGVAKEASIIAVKVVRDNGLSFNNGVIDGLEWIKNDHIFRSGLIGETAKSVVLLATVSNTNTAIDTVIQAMSDEGIIVVTAAGNQNVDACTKSPGRVPDAINVGSVDISDVSSSFTNYGSCINIFAPGELILSVVPGGSTEEKSGTSMAAAFVTGVVARYQQSFNAAPTPAQVADWLESEGTKDVISWYYEQHNTSPNILLYNEC